MSASFLAWIERFTWNIADHTAVLDKDAYNVNVCSNYYTLKSIQVLTSMDITVNWLIESGVINTMQPYLQFQLIHVH